MKLAIALLIAVATGAACAALGGSVPLLTSDHGAGDGCYTNFETGLLIANRDHGTDFRADEWTKSAPVRWPKGYSAHAEGSEVVVTNQFGQEVARTGRRYRLEGGSPPEGDAWLACGDVQTR